MKLSTGFVHNFMEILVDKWESLMYYKQALGTRAVLKKISKKKFEKTRKKFLTNETC